MNNYEKIKQMSLDEMAKFLSTFQCQRKAKEFLEDEPKEYKQLCYSMYKAHDCGIDEHPQVQMKKLGYKVISAVAQSLTDSWWFTVEDFIEPLPPYLKKFQYDYFYWHGDGQKIVC